MTKIALLTSSNMMPGAPERRADAFEFDLQTAAMRRGCEPRGFTLTPVVWDEEGVDYTAFDAALIGTTWDYWEKFDHFLLTLEGIAEQIPVLNPPKVVRWNSSKSYLKDLAFAGVATIETVWSASAEDENLDHAFKVLESETLVVKPLVGAGAWRQCLVKKGVEYPKRDQRPPGACLIQPFIRSVPVKGEVSVMAYAGRVSHALRKRPAGGDYRTQSIYGAREEVHHLSSQENDFLEQVMAALNATAPGTWLYARMDFVEANDGSPVLMEAEMIEPYHYPEQGPDCGNALADALTRIL